jgi:colanic acid/amylovoran biosynthesis glycosyltransferase
MNAGALFTQVRQEMALNVAIVKNKPLTLTETFIRAHAERLPDTVSLIVGEPPAVDGEAAPRRARLRHAVRLAKRYYGNPVKSRWAMTAEYTRLFRRHRTDVVLAEYGQTGVSVMKACEQLRLPLVVHFHGYDASSQPVLEQYRDAYRRMFRQAAAVIGVSRSMVDALVTMGAPAGKVHHIACGVEVDSFQPATPAGSDAVFLAVGRLVDKKAPHLLLLAFAEVHRKRPEARLRMIG